MLVDGYGRSTQPSSIPEGFYFYISITGCVDRAGPVQAKMPSLSRYWSRDSHLFPSAALLAARRPGAAATQPGHPLNGAILG